MSLFYCGEATTLDRLIAKGRHRKTFAAGLAALLLPSITLAFPLVSIEEANASAQYEATNPQTTGRTRTPSSGSPIIEIISPDIGTGAALQPPLTIHVKFEPANQAEIVPDSFRAQYGAFHIDITDRLLKATKVTKDGFHVDNAGLPPGNHRLFLKIRDNSDRLGEREVKFTVQ